MKQLYNPMSHRSTTEGTGTVPSRPLEIPSIQDHPSGVLGLALLDSWPKSTTLFLMGKTLAVLWNGCCCEKPENKKHEEQRVTSMTVQTWKYGSQKPPKFRVLWTAVTGKWISKAHTDRSLTILHWQICFVDNYFGYALSLFKICHSFRVVKGVSWPPEYMSKFARKSYQEVSFIKKMKL